MIPEPSLKEFLDKAEENEAYADFAERHAQGIALAEIEDGFFCGICGQECSIEDYREYAAHERCAIDQ